LPSVDIPLVPTWPQFADLIKAVGLANAINTVLLITAQGFIYWLYRGRLQDRQAEIDRLCVDNRDLRERFTKLLDKHMGYAKPEERQGREDVR